MYIAPLVFSGEPLSPNGIDGRVGQPLLSIDTAIAAFMARSSWIEPAHVKNLYKEKKLIASGAYLGGLGLDFSQSTLEETGWAVVMHADEDVALFKALWPLIHHRMRQMGFSKLDFDFQSSDTTCGAWLDRHTDAGKKSLQRNWGEISHPPQG